APGGRQPAPTPSARRSTAKSRLPPTASRTLTGRPDCAQPGGGTTTQRRPSAVHTVTRATSDSTAAARSERTGASPATPPRCRVDGTATEVTSATPAAAIIIATRQPRRVRRPAPPRAPTPIIHVALVVRRR